MLLGDHTPQALIDTLVYYISLTLLFMVKSIECCITTLPKYNWLNPLLEYLILSSYIKDVLRINQGGILHRKK